MFIKKVLVLSSVFLSLVSSSFAFDTLLVKRPLIGPPELVIPPPENPVLVRKRIVEAKLQGIPGEETELKIRIQKLQLRSLLQTTETSYLPFGYNLASLEKDLLEFRLKGDLKNQALIYATHGVQYGQLGILDNAIVSFKEALSYYQLSKDYAGISEIAEILSLLSRIGGNYEQAILYSGHVITANQALKNTANVANTYLEIAAIKFDQKKYKGTEYYILRKAFLLYQRTGNKYGRMNSFQRLAELYLKQERFSEAKWFYLQTQIMATKLNNVKETISSLMGLASVKYILGEDAEAFQDYHKAELIALQNNYLINLIQINAELGKMYSNQGDYIAAVNALDSYSRYRDSWLSANKL
jgi:tetratricopeptide (TPR) repeat protein